MSQEKYKALVTDLDGTALPPGATADEVDPAIRPLVEEAQDAGAKITCATGRYLHEVIPVATALGLTRHPWIIEGGTRIVSPSGETLWEKPLELGAPAEILEVCRRLSPSSTVVSSWNYHHLPVLGTTLPGRLRFVYLVDVHAATAEEMCAEIGALRGLTAHTTQSLHALELKDVHVTHQAATKENAALLWQSMPPEVSKEVTVVLGDSNNDGPLFEVAGLKVAVGNAARSLMERADIVAPSVTEGALAKVIGRFLLGRPFDPDEWHLPPRPTVS